MGTGYIDYAGYKECVNLQNDTVQVALGPHCGGRVPAYAWQGENAPALDPRQDGWTYGAGTSPMGGPSAERFDFGPEATTRAHPTLWVGPWEAEVAKELMI